MVRSSKVLAEIKRSKKKNDIRKFRDCMRSEKRDSENGQKSAFLLISPNKDSLCSGIQIYFYETAIIFL